MAVGSRLDRMRDKFVVVGTLLESAAATTAGTWVDTLGCWPLVVTVEGTVTGLTAKVLVSNAATKPADATVDVPQLGSDLTGPDSRTIDAPYRWVKVRVTALTTGSVSAYIFGG